jgi:hypothetical protein
MAMPKIKPINIYLLNVLLLSVAAVGTILFTGVKIKNQFLLEKNFGIDGLTRLIGPVDLLLLVVCMSLFALLALYEYRYACCSKILNQGSVADFVVLILAADIWFSQSVLEPGLMVTGDAGSHIARINHLLLALQNHQSLYWDNYFFGGGTLLQFTAPMFHWIATALAFALDLDATQASKALIVGSRIVGSVVVFLYLLQLKLARPAAFFGALCYALAFFNGYIISIRGAFPQALNLMLLPMIFYCLEAVLNSKKLLTPAWLGFCLCCIAMIGNHQSTAVVAALLAILYAVVRIGSGAVSAEALVLKLAASAALIGVGSVFFLLPFLLEKAWTAENFSLGIVTLVLPESGDIMNFLRWGKYGSGNHFSAYLGFSVLVPIVGAAWAMARRRLKNAMACLWWLFIGLTLLTLFVRGAYVRQTVFTEFFMGLAAAVSVQLLMQLYPQRQNWLQYALLFLLLDLLPGAVQPWNRSDFQAIAAAGDVLAEMAATQRVLEVEHHNRNYSVSMGPNSSPLHYSRVQMLYGPHKMDATKAHNAMMAALALAQADLQHRGALSADTANILSLYNVGWIVGHDGAVMGMPKDFAADLHHPALGAYARIATATPFIASGSLSVTPRPAEFDGFPFWEASDRNVPEAKVALLEQVRQMKLQLPVHQAQTLLLPFRPQGEEWAHDYPQAPEVSMRDYRVMPGAIELTLQANGSGYVRIAHPFYPAALLSVNGVETAAVQDIFSMLVVPVQQGINRIDVYYRPSPLRVYAFYISLTVSIALASALLWLTLPVRKRGV